jgi:hypothetical protein
MTHGAPDAAQRAAVERRQARALAHAAGPVAREGVTDVAELQFVDMVPVDQAQRDQLGQHLVDRKGSLPLRAPDPQAAGLAACEHPQLHRHRLAVEREDAQPQHPAAAPVTSTWRR